VASDVSICLLLMRRVVRRYGRSSRPRWARAPVLWWISDVAIQFELHDAHFYFRTIPFSRMFVRSR
jgi:hypothetical protein